MKPAFDEKKPIFLQIKEQLEDQIVDGRIQEHEQIPSTTQMVQFYQVNHLTIAKGMNQLADEGIIYKKRGVGMFVAEGAREVLRQRRRDQFSEMYIQPMMQEAEKLGLSSGELRRMIDEWKGGGTS
ncbi:GntR family transcriptional regulator [Alkalicoccus chagannorensis]|uniref:GntR family transcriptional regulator n=1 Tax=Alkalicoccus chagannorensis TaxID=427072 RepID=UPI0003FBD640|nr:GntR family transcriptional regulator [Alkalicoccus chagannorensis]